MRALQIITPLLRTECIQLTLTLWCLQFKGAIFQIRDETCLSSRSRETYLGSVQDQVDTIWMICSFKILLLSLIESTKALTWTSGNSKKSKNRFTNVQTVLRSNPWMSIFPFTISMEINRQCRLEKRDSMMMPSQFLYKSLQRELNQVTWFRFQWLLKSPNLVFRSRNKLKSLKHQKFRRRSYEKRMNQKARQISKWRLTLSRWIQVMLLQLEFDVTARKANASNYIVIALLLGFLAMNSVIVVDAIMGMNQRLEEKLFSRLSIETQMLLSQRSIL